MCVCVFAVLFLQFLSYAFEAYPLILSIFAVVRASQLIPRLDFVDNLLRKPLIRMIRACKTKALPWPNGVDQLEESKVAQEVVEKVCFDIIKAVSEANYPK